MGRIFKDTQRRWHTNPGGHQKIPPQRPVKGQKGGCASILMIIICAVAVGWLIIEPVL